ncbi:MAG: hypothetical protein HFE40_04150 [Clostridia bacterium]|jgi:hypothetical protein|nr:hypothetical protein [Clostridia bacterium]
MQFFIFMVCLFCGILSGAVYDVLYIARCFLCGIDKQSYTVKDKIFIIAADIFYCLVFAAGFIFVSVMFGFGTLRLYMLLGCLLGFLLYLKSFHFIVAFSVKKVYNGFTKRKEKLGGRTEEDPSCGGADGQRNIAGGNSRRRHHLSAGGNSVGKQKVRRNKKRDRKIRTADRKRK